MAREAIVVYWPGEEGPRFRAALQAALPEFAVHLHPDVGDPVAVTCIAAFRPPPGFFADFAGLQIICNIGAGVEGIVGRNDVGTLPIVRLVDPEMSRLMLNYVLFAVLRHARNIPAFEQAQRERRWHRLPPRAPSETTVGILGLGALGGVAATELARLGYRVLGWSRTPKEIAGVRNLCGADGLERLLAVTEVLVVMLPLTAQTHGLLDARRLALLPRGAAIVNVARGAIIDEPALVARLREDATATATLDVFSTEPLPPDHPFWSMSNVLITPHLASVPIPTTAAQSIAEALRQFRAGDPIVGRVDPVQGY